MNAPYENTSAATYATAVPLQPGEISSSSTKVDIKLPDNNAGDVNESQIQRLKQQGFTTGLAKSLSLNNRSFPLRIWVVDNSGSMSKNDGHRIVETSSSDNVKIVSCSRWDEIRECVNYHICCAGLLGAPTNFRLLNHPGAVVSTQQQLSICETSLSTSAVDVQNAISVMSKVRPGGCTPLKQHILEIYQSISTMAPALNANGQRIVIVLATDGLPTDERGYGGPGEQQQFVESLRLLEGLPVWVVIRLCTDEDDVVNFYNELDEQLELSLEVLDDFVAEAEEVYEHNKWMNYALPLHRCREMGYHDRVFDLIDERTLTKSELRDFCSLLFGMENMDGIPDPEIDWKGFANEITRLLKNEKMQWNPIKKKVTPWIDMNKLNRQYGKRGFFW